MFETIQVEEQSAVNEIYLTQTTPQIVEVEKKVYYDKEVLVEEIQVCAGFRASG